VAGGINDGEVELGRLELPEGDIDGDTTLALGLQLVKHPGVLERALAHLVRLLLELLDGALVNATALVDEVTSGRRLARVDVANDDQVNVELVLAHFCTQQRTRVSSGARCSAAEQDREIEDHHGPGSERKAFVVTEQHTE
jgi:hypothetical protein